MTMLIQRISGTGHWPLVAARGILLATPRWWAISIVCNELDPGAGVLSGNVTGTFVIDMAFGLDLVTVLYR